MDDRIADSLVSDRDSKKAGWIQEESKLPVTVE